MTEKQTCTCEEIKQMKAQMEGDRLNLISAPKSLYGAEYEKHLFEQYKMFVEMADRVSARRMLANSFFVGLHTALITAFTVMLKEKILPDGFVGLLPFCAVIALCYVWWRVVYSYRQLNSGKFAVVHEMERLMPMALFKGEWIAMGEGKDPKRYLPLTHVENYVPLCFCIMYALLGISFYFFK
ncbi:RipA family octameric membrane protein [Aeromonas enteropelogenes]|uniref:RipA family octameric membrane protein n=1 Tax=Aeromonas enteropelogenes TaxID=29489 RepID=UPI003BA0180B